MKRTFFTGLSLLLLAVFVGAAQKADFSGKWVLDRDKSEGLPPGMDQVMTVQQNGDQITIETKVMPEDQPSITVNDSYNLNGQEGPYTQRTPNGEIQGKRTSKWTADGKGIEVSEEATVDTPEGPVNIKATRKWQLAADGKTLTIEIVSVTPNGQNRSFRTFVKQAA